MLVERIASIGDSAAFWPGTGFIEFGNDTVLDDQWSSSVSNIFAASGLFHEHVHWTQYHSSTFGIFTFLLRHRRSEIIECYLRHLSPDQRRSAFSSWERGEPLWQFPTIEKAMTDDKIHSAGARRMAEHWNRLLIFDQIFRVGNTEIASDLDLRQLFKIAFLHTDGSFSIEEIFRSDDRYFDERSDQSSGQIGMPPIPDSISCRSLEECAAFLNQREFYANGDVLFEEGDMPASIKEELAALHDKRMEDYRADPSKLYVSCLDFYFDQNDAFAIDDPAALWVLLVIIDISLNPPLPPFCNLQNKFPRDGNTSLSNADLAQLNPVSRFAMLVEAVDDKDLPTDVLAICKDGHRYKALVAELCRKAGLMDPHSYLETNPVVEESAAVWSALEGSPTRYLKSHVLMHHRQASHLRLSRPSAFASPSHNILYDKDMIPYLTERRLQTLFLNPLQIVSGTGYIAGMSEEDYWGVLAAAGYGSALTSLLSPGGQFFGEGLPRDELHFSMVQKARDSLISRLRS